MLCDFSHRQRVGSAEIDNASLLAAETTPESMCGAWMIFLCKVAPDHRRLADAVLPVHHRAFVSLKSTLHARFARLPRYIHVRLTERKRARSEDLIGPGSWAEQTHIVDLGRASLTWRNSKRQPSDAKRLAQQP